MRLSRPLLEAILSRARQGYPFEVCGVLLGREPAPGADLVVERAVAVANSEPESPRSRFEIDPAELLCVQREARAAGLAILGYYHSHPDHPAEPSELDLRRAAEGLSDGVVHLIVSVDAGGAEPPGQAFVFREARRGFEPEPLELD